MTRTHVVFGATGGLGAALVRRLAAEGELVRAVVRDPEWASELLPASAGVVAADATDADSAREACRGASVVYHCVNVRYTKWASVMPVATENILAGARRAKARLLFPGNLYGYGPFQKLPITEDHPLAATSKKGRLRNAMEARLMEAHRAGEVPVVIPRFPDFYGINVTNPLFAPLFQAVLQGKTATWPARLDVPHDLVYVDDAAAAALLLAAKDDAYGQSWHVPGFGPLTGQQFIDFAAKAAGTQTKSKPLSRFLFRLVGPFIPDAGEMMELLYQFEQPLLLDGSKFATAFPSFRYTPHEEAIKTTVEWFRERAA